MPTCLFCGSDGPFNIEHIIPASLGNDDLLLENEVCCACNNHFSISVEAPVLAKTPLAFWRTYLRIPTRRNKLPEVDFSQPETQKGKYPSRHKSHDDGVEFKAHRDGSLSFEVHNDQLSLDIKDERRSKFQFVFTPKILLDFGRFLCKIGIELICKSSPTDARKPYLDLARKFARYGKQKGLWPIYHIKNGKIGDLKSYSTDENGVLEHVTFYNYAILEDGTNTLVCFGMGIDEWIVCLNDPYPTSAVEAAFPGHKVDLVWYSQEQLKAKK